MVDGQRPSDRLPLVPVVFMLGYTELPLKLTTYYVYVHIYEGVALSWKTRSYAAALVPDTRCDSTTHLRTTYSKITRSNSANTTPFRPGKSSASPTLVHRTDSGYKRHPPAGLEAKSNRSRSVIVRNQAENSFKPSQGIRKNRGERRPPNRASWTKRVIT